jgi:5-methylcytosine-specific restriction endonuclease McrA
MSKPKYRSYKNGITLYRKSKKDSCEICGSKENLIVHHKDEDRFNNKNNNLKTLCRSCHQRGHKVFLNFKEAYKKEPRDKKGRFSK